jgi:peptidoglycan hydrolase-like protein with peptidoglycan-binding domain
MAASRNPKPLGTNPEAQDLNDGTMFRRLSPHPGPVGRQASSLGIKAEKPVTLNIMLSRRGSSSGVGLQVLKQGSRGPEVQRLQRLLNRRLTPSPKLTVDGLFGSSTHQAVIQYQRGVCNAANGIVDMVSLAQRRHGHSNSSIGFTNPTLVPRTNQHPGDGCLGDAVGRQIHRSLAPYRA